MRVVSSASSRQAAARGEGSVASMVPEMGARWWLGRSVSCSVAPVRVSTPIHFQHVFLSRLLPGETTNPAYRYVETLSLR